MKSKKLTARRGARLVRALGTLVAVSVTLGACSKSSTPAATSTTLGLSGSFALTTAPSAFETFGPRALFSLSQATTDYSVYTLSCSTGTIPPTTVTGSVNSDGSFSLSIPSGINVPLNCAVLNQAGDLVANLIVQNSGAKDVNGNPTVTDHPAFTSGGTSLGTINLDTVGLQALVSSASVVGSSGSSALASGSAGTAFDPTGKYTIGDVAFTAPAGYRGTCTTAEQNDNTCNGPPAGALIYLQRYQGTNSADGSTAYLLQVWQDQSGGDPKTAMDSCGDVIGLSPTQLTSAGLSFTGSANSVFTFTTTINDPNSSYPTVVNASNATIGSPPSLTGATLSSLFEASTAYASWSIQGGVSVTAFNQTGWAQGPDDQQIWQVGLGGGCVDGSGNPVNVNQWPVSCTSNTGPTAVSGETGFYSNSCTGTATPQGGSPETVTCTSVWGNFNSASGGAAPDLTSPTGTNFDWSWWNVHGVLAYQNELCSDISTTTTAGQLAQLQCYAQYYQGNGGGNSSIQNLGGVCLPKIQTDFTATDPTKFVLPGHPPNNLVFMDKLNYPGANFGTLLTQQIREDGIQMSEGSQTNWIPCTVQETDGLSITPDPSTSGSYIATYASLTRTTAASSGNPSCVAAFNGAPAQKFIFELTPQ